MMSLMCALTDCVSPNVTFTARRYACAVFAVVVCPSVYLYVCHEPICIETTGRIELFSHAGSFRRILHCVSRNIEYLQT